MIKAGQVVRHVKRKYMWGVVEGVSRQDEDRCLVAWAEPASVRGLVQACAPEVIAAIPAGVIYTEKERAQIARATHALRALNEAVERLREEGEPGGAGVLLGLVNERTETRRRRWRLLTGGEV